MIVILIIMMEAKKNDHNDEGDPSRLDINALLPQNKPYVVNE